MSAEIRARALEPFFTTKPVGEGTGMGLAVVHGIVESHQGAMRIESAEEEGTTVDVFLKSCEPDCESAEPSTEERPRGRARVLLVDDEDAVRESGRALLELRGYRVAAAANGVDALDLLGTTAFDIVVTDQTMPGMTGIQLSEQIVRLLPDLPVILITGRSEPATPEKPETIGIRKLLKKPVDFDELVRTVESVLSDPQRSQKMS
jgi:CheY-like chemotaxis protein